MKYAPLIGLLLLAGCVSPEWAARVRQEEEQRDIALCTSYGFAAGSESFANCRLQLEVARTHPYYYDNGPYYSGYRYYRY